MVEIRRIMIGTSRTHTYLCVFTIMLCVFSIVVNGFLLVDDSFAEVLTWLITFLSWTVLVLGILLMLASLVIQFILNTFSAGIFFGALIKSVCGTFMILLVTTLQYIGTGIVITI